MKKTTLFFLLILTMSIGYSQTFTDNTTHSIQNGQAGTSSTCGTAFELDAPLTVSGVGVLGTTNVFDQLEINITHTWDSDLDIYLTAPDGTSVEISTDNGGSGDNYTNTIFRADAANSITTGTAPFTGTFLPEGDLSVLNGIDADGDWNLEICDDANGDVGTLDSWSITFTPAPDCVQPSAFTINNISSSDVEFGWLANNGETSWEIVIQAPGTGEPTGAGTTITTNPYTATGLNPSTTYEVYIRANCSASGDGFSTWAGPFTFTTDNIPPPAPVGVTCSTGTSTFIFTEDFDQEPPTGWTGDFGTTNGTWDITNGNANSTGTGPSASYSGATHMEFEASGSTETTASAVTPAIDLSSAVDGAELSFYMHAYGEDMGTLEVNIGTSATGPFTNLYSWIGEYQTTDTDPWIPIGVNLDAYLGQVVYIEFSYTGTTSGFEGDMSIDYVRVEACGDFCIAPTAITASNQTDTTVDISWTPSGSETTWYYVVQPAGTGEPTGTGTAATSTTVTVTGLNPLTDYEVYVMADCGSSTSIWTGPTTFTTNATPPPAPVGVTCSTGSSTFIFTEDFDQEPPSGWTGDFGTTNGTWDITTGNANSTGTGPSASYSGTTHMEYEASGTSATTASAITPAIDLTNAVDGAELSFYMHAYGADTGTLEVNIGSSATGPFTNLYTWAGEYQTADTDPWIPIGLNLDAYLGQVVYIEFSYTGTTTGYEGDLSIDYVRVEACGDFCIAPSGITASNLTSTSADISWTPSGSETTWYYVIQPAGTGEPTGTGTLTTTTTFSDNTLTPDTDYEVYVMADCGSSTSIWAGPYTFTTPIQTDFTVDCGAGAINTVYCYPNNDTTVFTFTSSDGVSPLILNINAGQVENNWDELIVYDSDGTTNLNAATPYGATGNVSGLSFQSTGTSISIRVQSDGSVNCQTSGYTSLDFDVICATCINPTVDYNVISNCGTGDQFSINVSLTDMGDATTININDDQGSATQAVTATGTYTFGPYANGTPVVITTANADDANCTIVSDPLIQYFCPPDNDECFAAMPLTVNPEFNCTDVTSATTAGATPSGEASSCTGTTNDDVWFEFVATSTTHVINISNILGDNTDLSFALYEGTDCTSLTEIYCTQTSSNFANGLTAGNTYKIRVFTTANSDVGDSTTFDICVSTLQTDDNCATLDSGEDITLECANNNEVDLEASFFAPGFDTSSYEISPTACIPDVQPGTPTGLNIDDTWSGIIDIGFDFCFFGNTYSQLIIGANGLVSFNIADANTYCPWQFNESAPDPNLPLNAIYGVYQDINPATCGNIEYYITGTAPFRQFVISFNDVCLFSCTSLTASTQIVLYETTGVVEVNVIDKPTCSGWNNGNSLLGVQNADGTIAYTPPGRNTGDWEAYNESWRFIPGGPANYTFQWYEGTTPLSTDPTLTVSPTETTTYTAEMTYFLCDGTSEVLTDDVTVTIIGAYVEANQADDIEVCDDNSGDGVETFDLTANETTILSGQTDVTITYHETEVDATADTNAIVDPTAYTSTSSSQTIYVRVEDADGVCYETTTFDIIVNTLPITDFPGNYEVCSNGITPVELVGTATNYDTTTATYQWYQDGVALSDETALTLQVYDSGLYTLEVTTATCTNTTDVVVAESNNCIIPQGISPDGDGINENFDLTGFNVQKIQIFNRLGSVIFEQNNYTDQWHGQSDNGELLPVGTYYYVLTFADGRDQITGWVYVNY